MALHLNSSRVGVIGPPFAQECKWPAKVRDLVTIEGALARLRHSPVR